MDKRYIVVAIGGPEADNLADGFLGALCDVFNSRPESQDATRFQAIEVPTIDAARSALTEANWSVREAS